MIRMILLDIDGTLLGRTGVHPSAWTAIADARARGVHVGLCTGRIGVGQAADLARRVAPEGLHIFQSGAVVSAPGEPAVYAARIDPATVAGLIAVSRREREPIEAYTETTFHLEWHTPLTRVHEEHLALEAQVGDLDALAAPVVRLQWVVTDQDWPRFRELTAAFPAVHANPATAPWSPGTVFSNLTSTGTSKASAIHRLAAHLGFTPREVAMVGDGENDREAIAAAGLGIAVANAPESVRAAASRVVSDPDAGGVAEAIRIALAS